MPQNILAPTMEKNDLPTLIALAGPNGAGKSTVTSAILELPWVKGNFEYINADDIASSLPGGWGAPGNMERAWKEAERRRLKAFEEKRNFIYETLIGSEMSYNFLDKSGQSGYSSHIHFIGTESVDICLGRNRKRGASGKHFIPEEDVKRLYSVSKENFIKLATKIDHATIYDNSIDNRGAQAICRLEKGNVVEWTDSLKVPNWVKEMVLKINLKNTLPQKSSSKFKESPFPSQNKEIEIDM